MPTELPGTPSIDEGTEIQRKLPSWHRRSSRTMAPSYGQNRLMKWDMPTCMWQDPEGASVLWLNPPIASQGAPRWIRDPPFGNSGTPPSLHLPGCEVGFAKVRLVLVRSPMRTLGKDVPESRLPGRGPFGEAPGRGSVPGSS